MTSRSTIFSSETAQFRPRVPWDWVLALGLLAAVNATVAVLDRDGRLPGDFQWKSLGRLRAYQETLAERPEAQIVLVGSSTVRRLRTDVLAAAVDPSGRLTVADASFPGATTAATAYAVKNLVLHDFRPKAIVYGLDTQSVNEHGPRRSGQEALITNLRILAETPARWAVLWWARENVALYRKQFVLREWLHRPWSARIVEPPPEDSEVPGAWTLAESPNVILAEKDHRLGPQAEREIAEIAAAARAAGVRLVLANMPFPPEYVGVWPDGRATYDRYLRTLESLAARLSVPLVDLNDGSYGHDDFSDCCHLAGAGAGRASRILGLQLRELLGAISAATH